MVKLLDDGSFTIPGEERVHDSLDALVTFYQQQPLRPHGDLLMQSCPQVRIGTPQGPSPPNSCSCMPPLPLEIPSFLQSLFPWGPAPPGPCSLGPQAGFFTGIHVPGITLSDLPE